MISPVSHLRTCCVEAVFYQLADEDVSLWSWNSAFIVGVSWFNLFKGLGHGKTAEEPTKRGFVRLPPLCPFGGLYGRSCLRAGLSFVIYIRVALLLL